MNVLVIESDQWLAEHFEQILTKSGFTVTVASNAYSAMDVIDETHPDVIVMGLLLNGAVGIGLLHELQSYGDTAKLPIIVCSSAAAELPADELEPYGVRRVLDTNTMKPDDLVGAVRSVLNENN